MRLAADANFQLAIVALDSSSRVSSATMLKLREKVPHLIVVVERPEEIVRLPPTLLGAHSFVLQEANEQDLVTRVSEVFALADGLKDGPIPAHGMLYIDNCKLDLAGHVAVAADGREIALTRAEVDLLRALGRYPHQVVSRDQLRHAIAGRSAEPFDRSVDMLVARLRRKIEPDPKDPRFLVTVPGAGYKLVTRQQRSDARQAGAELTEPERRQITALFCSLVGGPELAVSFDPEDLSWITKHFQEAVVGAITEMGGTIGILAADEVLAFFGYPEAHEDDAERAVKAGLDVVSTIDCLSSPGGEQLQVRVGIATGLAFVSQKQAIGEPSVIAPALCAQAAPNSILVTSSTRRLLSSAFICGHSEQYTLAGISKVVNGSCVTGKRVVGSRFKAKRSNKIERLVGRDQELADLLGLWERAKLGEGQVAFICGEPGIGKSHLCEFFIERIAKERHASLRYQCSPHHLNSPFYPVICQLEHAMGFEQTDTPELKLEKLQATLSQVVKATREDIYLYTALLSIPTPRHELPLSSTPQRQRDLTVTALVRHLRRLADNQPLAVVVADAHWIDASSLELLNRVIPQIKSDRVMFVIKARPEFVPQWESEPHVTVVRLDRMGRQEGLAIILEVTGGKKLPEELQEQIVNKADGVPLYIEELTRAVLESGFVEDVGDRFIASGPSASLVVPTSLLDSLTARLDRLGAAKQVVQIAAVVGREFSYTLLAAVASEAASYLSTALAQLAASGLISMTSEKPDTTYVFKHALVRDAAYAALSRVKRQRLHARVADALESLFPLTIESQPELLAHHLAHAGRTARAIDFLQQAGQRSIERSNNAEAIGHLTHALDLVRGGQDSLQRRRGEFALEVMLSQAMIGSYGYAAPRTRATLLRASALIDDSTEQPQKFVVLYGIWASHYVAGEIAKQRSAAAKFLSEAKRTGDTGALCVAHRIVGTAHIVMGEFATGLGHLKQARELYDPEKHAVCRHQYGQDIGASVFCYLSWALWQLGYVDQAAETAAEGMGLAEELAHPHTLVYTICHARGFMDLFRRRGEDMQGYASAVVSVCNANGFSHWGNCGAILEGWGTVCAGQVTRGIAMLREGLLAWQKGGAGLWMPTFLMLQAEAYAKAGRPETALQVINEARGICDDTGECWAMAELLRTKASFLQSTSSRGEIELILLEGLEIARHQQARCWELRTACDLSRLWARHGRIRKAHELLQSAYSQFTEGFDTADLRDAQKLLQKLERNIHRKRSKMATKTIGMRRRRSTLVA